MSVDEARATASKMVVSAQERQVAIETLLRELKGPSKSKESASALANLQALKLLGRNPQGSEPLAEKSNLELLCDFAQLRDTSVPTKPGDSCLEAWRVLCNTLKLHPQATLELESFNKVLESSVTCISAGPPSIQFLTARLIFLLTVKGSEVNRTFVDKLGIVSHLYQALQKYADALDVESPKQLTPEEHMALSELLKMLYNLAVFYPRIKTLDPKADVDSSAEETVSPSSSASSPETEALPATSKSTALGRGLRSMWSRTGTRSRPTSPSSSPKSPVPKGLDHLASALVRLIVLLPHQSDQPLSGSPLGGALLSLGELPASSCWFTDRNVPAHAQIAQSTLPSTSTQPDVESIGTLPPLPAKLVSVLDNSLEYCFPGDVEGDDAANRKRLDRAGRAVEDLDAELAPLLLIIRKCVVSDEQGAVGATLRARLLSNNIDRSSRMDQRPDLTGRLLRLMNSVYFSNTKVGAGELLFALCGQDAELFTATLGYGLAAGFLASNGILGTPRAPHTEGSVDKRPINPVTGVYEPEEPEPSPSASMTPEEQEREAERLFVLFERLKKTGVVDIQNPVEAAQQSGRFEEVDEESTEEKARRQRAVDDQEEQEAVEEMQRWKNRNAPRQT